MLDELREHVLVGYWRLGGFRDALALFLSCEVVVDGVVRIRIFHEYLFVRFQNVRIHFGVLVVDVQQYFEYGALIVIDDVSFV